MSVQQLPKWSRRCLIHCGYALKRLTGLSLRAWVLPFLQFFRHVNWGTLRTTLKRAAQQRFPGLAAEMAYNATLSIFPATLAIIAAIGLFGRSTRSVFQALVLQLSEVIPQEVLQLVQNFIRTQVYEQPSTQLFSFSFLAAIWIASSTLGSAMAALDRINKIPRSRTRPFWLAKIVAIGLTLGTFALMIVASVSVLVSGFLVQGVADKSSWLPIDLLRLWQWLSWPLALSVVAIAAAFIYRYGPSRWRWGTPILPGAILASLLWAGVSSLFSLYVSHYSNYNQLYGALGTVIVLLLWLYLSSLALLLGAQLNIVVGESMQQSRRRHAKKRRQQLE